MNLADYLLNHTYFFILVFMRYLGIFIITPVFSSEVILTRIKVGLSLLFTIVSFPLLQEMYQLELPNHLLVLLADVAQELALGFVFGFVLLLIFAAVQLAGKLIDLRMGFRIANELDPLTGDSAPMIGQFKNILATLTFLAINGHLIVLKGLFDSFELIQPGEIFLTNSALWELVIRRSADLFIVGFQVALPVVGTVFMIDVLLGFLARSVPQMNIFIVGLPFKILVGFVIMFLAMNVMISFYQGLFEGYFEDMMYILNLLG